MNLASLFRWLPTPGYGKCGGADHDCSVKPPRDWMDLAFERHDRDLFEAEKIFTQKERDNAREDADSRLAEALKDGDPKKLKLYGRIYRRLAMVVFKGT